MASEATLSDPETQVKAGHLRLVLFGMPAAGKSSLLGALSQAAQTQEHLLNGRLRDISQGLSELQHRLYDGTGRRTADEVVPYPIEFTPFNGEEQKSQGKTREVVLIDCDGRVANDLLARRQALPEDNPEGTLANEVVKGDALILVVDASAPESQIEADFAEFDRFLRQMERSRGQRAEIGGLPVFLVLTKCDLLAQKGDTYVEWVDRIEERKREVDNRFRTFLDRQRAEQGPLPFGEIDLNLWATAVKRPALASNPAKPREPYGVAELFRLAIEEGGAFRTRRHRASRRLWWMVGIAVSLVLGMLSLIGYQIGRGNTQPGPLQASVDHFRDERTRPSFAEWLDRSATKSSTNLTRLKQMIDNPDFSKLSEEDQQFIQDLYEQLRKYRITLRSITQAKPPGQAANREELNAIESQLEKLPHWDDKWENTLAERTRQRRLKDVLALHQAGEEARNWYLDQSERAHRLANFADYAKGKGPVIVNWREWADKTRALLARKPPFQPNDVIASSPTGLTYQSAMRIYKVNEQESRWKTDRDNLERLLAITSALGILHTPRKYPATLVFQKDFSLSEASNRLRQLEKHYRNVTARHKSYQELFTLQGIPDAILRQVKQTAETNYQYLLHSARNRVLEQLRKETLGNRETREGWLGVRSWLRSPPSEMVAWNNLAVLLLQMQQPDRKETPIQEMIEFLGKNSFSLTFHTLKIEIPFSLNLDGIKPRPDASFLIYDAGYSEGPALNFELKGKPYADDRERIVIYTYRLSKQRTLTFQPGEPFWAELNMRQNRRFTWVTKRSSQYQFGRLFHPPHLHDDDKEGDAVTKTGKLKEEVRLILSPSQGVPTIPDLMPEVELTK